eukprot:TRINITY_DN21_c0_g2_i4.p2 TRINITY_DN21_c0_g2~~TRINITY_DN21_c0_g2_i4.p2  ORF type:complete len:272 (+),score=43.72 TRINITY_DN21_c0_g2_i4:222-1037(+)
MASIAAQAAASTVRPSAISAQLAASDRSAASSPATSLKGSFLCGGAARRLAAPIRPVAAQAASTSRPLTVVSKGNWLPGSESPAYLDGSLPGDNGFDPLELGREPEQLRWLVQAELQNGRWAMLGVAGMIVPEVLTKIGIWNAPLWYDAGKADYFASASTLFIVELFLFAWVESRRWMDIINPGSVSEDPIFKGNKLPPGDVGYPGGIFNPLGFAASFEAKEKEIANGRLAMLAFLGYVVQSKVTGDGPFGNLLTHLSDPWHTTIIQTLSK